MFALNARHVQTVDLLDQRSPIDVIFKRMKLLNVDAHSFQLLPKFFIQLQVRVIGRHEKQTHAGKLSQYASQRSNRAASTDVSAECVRFVPGSWNEIWILFLQVWQPRFGILDPLVKVKASIDRVIVQQRLSRMFVATRAGVNDRNRSFLLFL